MPDVDTESRHLDRDAATRPIPVYIASTVKGSDDISLLDSWRVIIRRKGIVFLSFLLSMLLAFGYLLFTEPLYKADAHLLPPHQQMIQGLLIDYGGIEEGYDVDQYTPETVYKAFLDNLASLGMRREFFNNNELIKHYAVGKPTKDINADRVFEKLFNERLTVHVDRKNPLFVTVSFSDRDPELAAQWLNQIIDLANKRTVHQMFNDVNAAIQSEIGKTRFQLNSKLKLAQQRRLDRIVILKEALRVAKALGIQDTSSFARMGEETQSGLVVNTAQAPLYALGAKALEVEMSVLEARNSDEPFITGYRDLQERQAFLEGISIDAGTLSAVTLDEAARIPFRTDQPRKGVVILVMAVLGMMIGLFAAFLTEQFSKPDQQSDRETRV